MLHHPLISNYMSYSFLCKIYQESLLSPLIKVYVHWIPLVRSTDVRSIFAWSQSKSAIVDNNPDVRSTHLYGQFSMDKTLTLQAGATVARLIGRKHKHRESVRERGAMALVKHHYLRMMFGRWSI